MSGLLNITSEGMNGYCGGGWFSVDDSGSSPYQSATNSPRAINSVKSNLDFFRRKLIFTKREYIDFAHSVVKNTFSAEAEKVNTHAWEVGDHGLVLIPEQLVGRSINGRSVKPRTGLLCVPTMISSHQSCRIPQLHYWSTSRHPSTLEEHTIQQIASLVVGTSSNYSLCAIRHNTRWHATDSVSSAGAHLYNYARKKGMSIKEQHNWFLISEKHNLYICFPFPLFTNATYGRADAYHISGRGESMLFGVGVARSPEELPVIKRIDDVRF